MALLALFGLCALIVPTMTPIATTDDWGYSRPVEILRDSGDLTVFPVVAATAVFQILWGTLFSLVFGMSLGIVRVSTLVMTAIGAASLYWLLRMLGVSRGRAALGMATYLFNPLAFILAYTFMTDPHLTGLMLLATALTVRGLQDDKWANRATFAGSLVCGCAFLTRQQGVLIPVAIVLFLMVSRRIWFNRASIAPFLRVTAIPLLMFVGYYVWLRFFNDVPDVQTGFLEEVTEAGVPGAWTLVRNLTFIEAMYIGFFCLPITIAAVPMLYRVRFALPKWGWLVMGGVLTLFLLNLELFNRDNRHMPYVPQFVGSGGLGPADVRGSRARLVEQPWFDIATVICAVSIIVIIVLIGRTASHTERPRAQAAGLVAMITLVQIGGILPPSFHYLNRGYSLDRYLLPLLPLSIALLLWAVQDVPIVPWLGWLVIAVFTVVNVAATRDYLVFMETVWRVADTSIQQGAREDQIDAGAAWVGYHLYTDGEDRGLTRAITRDGPWWTFFYGRATDSTYVVSSRVLPGYVIEDKTSFDTWLPNATRTVYLLRRVGAPSIPGNLSDLP